MVTAAELLAIEIEPVVVKTMTAIHENAAGVPKPRVLTPRAGTKQATLISMLRVPDGATTAGTTVVQYNTYRLTLWPHLAAGAKILFEGLSPWFQSPQM